MGELMFKYTVSPEFGYELMFKYLYSRSVEHSFAYQRYIALSDASVFNNPVAITKVATGFIDLHGLFVDKNAHPVRYYQQLQEAESRTSFVPNQLSSDRFLFRPQHDFSEPLPEIFLERPDLILNKQDILFGQYRKGMWVNENDDHGYLDRNSFQIYDRKYGGEKSWEFTPWTESLMGNRGEITNNIYHQDGMWYDDRVTNIPYQDMMSWRDRLGFNILPMFFGRTYDKIGNHNPTLMGWRDRLGFNILPMFLAEGLPDYHVTSVFENTLAYRPDPVGNHYENLYAIIPGKATAINQMYAGHTEIRYGNHMQGQGFTSVPTNRRLNKFDIHNLYYETRIGNIIESCVASKYGYKGHVNQIYSFEVDTQYGTVFSQSTVYAFGKTGGYLDLEDFCVRQEQYLGITDNVTASVMHKHVFDTNEVSVAIIQKALGYTPSDVFIDTIVKHVFTTNNTQVTKIQYDSQYIPTDAFASLYLKPVSGYLDAVFISKTHYGMFTQQTESFAHKVSKEINKIPAGVFADKDKAPMFLADNGTSIHKLAKELHTLKDNAFQGTWSIKDRLGMGLSSQTSVHKVSKKLHDLIDNVFAGKLPYDMSLGEVFVGLQKEIKDVRVFQKGVDALKGRIIAKYDDDFDSLIKGCHDTNFFGIGQYRGLMIPVSKLRHQAYIDRIDDMISKLYKDVMISQGTFASVIPEKVSGTFPDLFCDKSAHQIFIDYKNTFITKEAVRVSIFADEFVSKVGKDITVYKDSAFAYKIPKEIWISDTFAAILKEQRVITVHQDIGLIRHPYKFNIHDDVFVDKEDQICYYDYGQWAEKMKYSMVIQQQDIVYQKQRDTHIMNLTTVVEPQAEPLYINKIYHAEIIKNASLYQQIEEIHRMYYHCGIRPEDFGNWVWVYETPDPFEKDPFGIDELLLPEKDTRYEDFEDIIFDKKRMRPKNPVKKIDETTFIAKYPNKHPLPKYSDIGIDYDASAIKLENYYGIETSIMHTIFLKYYRIWQSKLFEFSTMTMVQSVKLMLEYIYSWIMIYFPPEQIEQALRVFRLIRWYSESAIITNSQYIISYEYEDLKSKLTTGTCAIPNDVDPDENGNVVNPTMYVDAANGVIRNTPTLIGVSDAYVTFTINIKKNSTFSFSLRNTVGSVNIYIDNVLVDTVSSSQLLLSYPLNYTGSPIVIKVIKTRINNLNHMFCIGNITVANGAFKDLSIEFDPTLKAGNKPLDEVAKKMLQYANEYDNIQEAYENVRKTNLGVSETYKKMVEYWKLHHEDKIKGKRLTIKEV